MVVKKVPALARAVLNVDDRNKIVAFVALLVQIDKRLNKNSKKAKKS